MNFPLRIAFPMSHRFWIAVSCPHHTQWAKSRIIPPKIRNKTGLSAFTSLIQCSNGSPSHSNQTEQEIKVIKIGKEEVNLLFRCHDIVHREPQRFHQETTKTDKFS